MGMTSSLQEVRNATDQARGLPHRFYTDPQMFEEEKRRVFFGGWSGAGFSADIPDPGCVMPIEFLGTPLFAVHGNDNQLRVFQNVCRHRGMTLVQTKGRVSKLIRCPYHLWSYDLDGKLQATPHVGGPNNHSHPSICKQGLGLFEIRAHEFHGVIFVDLSGGAPPFSEYAKELKARWRVFDLPMHSCGEESSLSLEGACNSKLVVENFCESYHLPFIHPSLNQYSRLEDHYPIEQPGKISGQGSGVYSPRLSDSGRRLPDFPGIEGEWERKAEYISFFPNVLLGIHRDHVYSMLLQPSDCENTVERLEIFCVEDIKNEADVGELLHTNRELWRTVFSEDVGVIEGMQRGRHCDNFDGGRYSPVMDVPTHLFHNWVADRLVRGG